MRVKSDLIGSYLKKYNPTVFDSGIGARLPNEYRKFYDEWRNTPPQPVHYIPYTGSKWIRTEQGEIKRVEDLPLKTRMAPQLHSTFTGGEQIIQGFIKKEKKYSPSVPKFWVPKVYKSVIYSEILDKYMSALMTKRVVELIHQHQGLDYYLLETKACDLVTLIALGLKRKLLLALRDKDLPYDEEKNKIILEKYDKYLLPPEEVEWYGLSFSAACKKLQKIEEERAKASVIPLKHIYRANLIAELQNPIQENEESEKKSSQWFTKIPGLSKFSRSN